MKGNEIVITDNERVKTSVVCTMVRQPDISIHEQRVLIQLMKYCQQLKNGWVSDDPRHKIEVNAIGDIVVTMPISDAFFSDMKPKEVEDTLIRLRNRVFQWRQKTGPRKRDYTWWACGFIEKPKVEYGTGMMEFQVTKDAWRVYNQVAEGFRIFELAKAMNLPTSYAMKFYMLLNGAGSFQEFTIEEFKEWLGIPDEAYRDKNGKHRPDNLEKVVIKPSQKVLDETCDWTFTYEKIKKTPHPRSAITGFKFTAVEQPDKRDPKLEKGRLISKIGTGIILGSEVYRYLKTAFGFTPQGLSATANKALFDEWSHYEPDPMAFLKGLSDNLPNPCANPCGYVINAIKKRTEVLKSIKSAITRM